MISGDKLEPRFFERLRFWFMNIAPKTWKGNALTQNLFEASLCFVRLTAFLIKRKAASGLRGRFWFLYAQCLILRQ